MPSTIGTRIRPDANVVRLSNNFEARYWMQVFAVSRSRLESAVLQVGSHADAIRRHLNLTVDDAEEGMTATVSNALRP